MTSKRAGELVSQNMKTIYVWSLSKVSNPTDAEDLCSDIITAVIESAEKLKCDEAFYGFVWQIASNTYKNYLRRKTRHPSAEIDENLSDCEDVLSDICDKEELNLLRRELSLLSLKYRVCTVAYYFDGLSVREIASKYGFTPETVKVILFKSRKILKEGIYMTREFGEKSYKPSPIYITSIIDGDNNDEFNNLISRKLAGQIIHTAYYEPVTVLQLSVELGVASMYIEDEIELLISYGLLKKQGDKYQSNILMLSSEYISKVLKLMSEKFTARIGDVLSGIKARLPEILKLDFERGKVSETALLWDLYTYFCVRAMFETAGGAKSRPLYKNTAGVVYALEDTSFLTEDCGHRAYAGECALASRPKVTFIQFRCLCESTHYLVDKLDTSEIPLFKRSTLGKIQEIISDDYEAIKQIFTEVGRLQKETLCDFTPESSKELIDDYCPHVTLWTLSGWFGYAARESGALELPHEGEHVGIVGYLD